MRLILLTVSFLWIHVGIAQNSLVGGVSDKSFEFTLVDKVEARDDLEAINSVAAVRIGMFNLNRHARLTHRLNNRNTHYMMEIRYQRLLKEFVWQQLVKEKMVEYGLAKINVLKRAHSLMLS